MRIESGTDFDFVSENGQLTGLSFGADATTEHECGIKPIARAFGVTYEGFGVDARKVRCVPETLRLINQGEDLWLLFSDRSNQEPPETQLRYRTWKKDPSPQMNLACGWSDTDFAVRVRGEVNIRHLREIYEAFLRCDVAFVMTHQPFMTGFNIIIHSRFPEKANQEWVAKEQAKRQVMDDWKRESEGLEAMLRAAGKRWFSLGHDAIRDDQGVLRTWLNPEEQRKYRAGWFSRADLEAWARDEGRIIIPPQPQPARGKKSRQW